MTVNLVSPGVYVRELDFSDYAARISTTVLGIVGVAKKGPMHDPTLITTEQELIDTFGTPPDVTAGANERQRLTVTASGTVSGNFTVKYQGVATANVAVGAGSGAALQAALEALSAIGTGNVTVTGNITASGGTCEITFVNGMGNRSLELLTMGTNPTNGVGSITRLTVGATTPSDYGMLAALFFLREGNRLYFTRTCQVSDTGDWLATIAQSRSAAISGAIQWDATTSAEKALTASATSPGEWGNSIGLRFTKLAGSQNDKQSLVFSDQASGRNGETFKLTIGANNSADIAFSNVAATMRANLTTGIEGITGVGSGNITVTGSGTTADPYVIEFGGTVAWTAFATMTRTAPSAGTVYAGTITIASVQDGVSPAADVYTLEVIGPIDNAGSVGVLERFARVMLINDETVLSANDAYFMGTAVNDGIVNAIVASRLIEFTISTFPSVGVDVLKPLVDGTPGDGTTATYYLYGGFAAMNAGQSGVEDELVAAYVGTEADPGDVSSGFDGGPTALQTFANPDALDVNLLIIPGITTQAILTELLAVCEDRQDCMSILDTPQGLTHTEVVEWHNRTGAYASTGFKPNSSFGALYWTWCSVYDPYNKKTITVPPTVVVPGQYAVNDRVAEPWFAPAGFQRGRLRSVLSVASKVPSRGALDNMYSGGNVINPIIDFTQNGPHIWGQRTTQRRASALDRVNVRRMLLYAEKVIATTVKYIVFEPNDSATWNRFVSLVTPVLENIKDSRGLYDFKVICDEQTNPPDQIDQNVMRGVLLLKPTKTAEIIQIDFTLLSTGARFAIPEGV